MGPLTEMEAARISIQSSSCPLYPDTRTISATLSGREDFEGTENSEGTVTVCFMLWAIDYPQQEVVRLDTDLLGWSIVAM